ncbi:MAG: hypothetical protein GWN00_22150, partial [Aliifodinibius sp.]|nr:hypothetical protein [candidate division Zixibacteria bacterium]NIS46113.1 hypothetical protein [candidate division Zixibacteria bacterium]NIT58824.1 hypothetical protein [Fodinibius sp.]NIV06286.1 hypothetical protein [candidate division Zixibacteria bacterium]NIY27407.1 hypothetical protein [Fodinibius sp.]
GHVIESLSGFGFTYNTLGTATNIGAGNPASLADYNHFAMGVSFQYDTEIEDGVVGVADHRRTLNGGPQSAGTVLPHHNWRFGVAYSKKYSSIIKFEETSLTVPSDPDGLGSSFSPEFKRSVNTPMLIGAYVLKNALSPASRLSFGARVGLDFLNVHEEILSAEAEVSDRTLSWSIGLKYSQHGEIFNRWQIGAFYEKGAEFSEEIEYEGVRLQDNIDGNFVPITSRVEDQLPDKLSAGFLLQPSSKLMFTGDVIAVVWDNVNENFENQLELAANAILLLDQNFSLSIGFFRTHRTSENSFIDQDQNEAYYFSGGIRFPVSFLNLDLVVADSHLFSGDWRKQSIVKFGIGAQL